MKEQTFESFVSKAAAAHVHLKLDNAEDLSTRRPDALFHLPLLSLTILTISAARRAGVSTSEIGTWTALTIQRAFSGLNVSPQRLRFSVVLRKRCADALVFLEGAGLSEVSGGNSRIIRASKAGKELLRKAAADPESDAGVLVRGLARSYVAARKAGRELI